MCRTDRSVLPVAFLRPLWILPALLLIARVSLAQSAGDYRSVGNGLWDVAATWETYDGAAWIAASIPPDATSGVITILAGDTVSSDQDVAVDQLVIEASGQLSIINKTLDVVDGSGTDLVVNGSLLMNDNIEILGTATATFNSGSDLTIAGGEFRPKDDSVVDFLTGSQVTVTSGRLRPQQFGLVRFAAGTTLENWDAVQLDNDSSIEFNGATYINHATTTAGGGATITFNSGSLYRHARDGGNLLPEGNTIWNSGSTCEVTGITTSGPGQADHSYHHFTWNSPGQTAAVNLNIGAASVTGDFTVVSTGTGYFSWKQNGDAALPISGSYVQTGGTFVYADGSNSDTMSVATDLTITAGELRLNGDDGTPTLTVAGTFDLSGGSITETGIGTAKILLDGTTNQSITTTGTITGDVDIELDNSAGATLQSALAAPRHLTLTTGTLDLNSNDLSVAGDFTINSAFSNAADIIFDGTGNGTLTHGSGSLSLAQIRLDKTGSTLFLNSDLTITTTANLDNGTLDVNGRTFTLEAGKTMYKGAGTVVGNITFKRDYTLDADGWRMVASPLGAVNYSTLNSVFHTQGGLWATIGHGESNLRSLNFAAQDWDEIKTANAPFTESEGYIFYMWADDTGGGDILPATWTVSGTLQAGTDKSLAFNTTPVDSWTLVGNPLTGNIDWDAAVAASTNVGTTYATWDPFLTDGGGLLGYKYYNSITGVGDAGRYIPPFQAFMAQALLAGATLNFATSETANSQAANYFGKTIDREISPHVRMRVAGNGMAENETYLVFDARAQQGADQLDVQRLQPISQEYLTLWFANGSDFRLAFDSRPLRSGQEEYAMHVDATVPGWYTLSWPTWHDVPAHWRVTFVDNESGARVEVDSTSTYLFEVTEKQAALSREIGFGRDTMSRVTPRFRLRVVDTSIADPDVPALVPVPSQPTLAQNYPNPFAERTTLKYALPQTGNVRLVVYDLLGRRVTTLVDGYRDAGWYDVVWDASGVASGVYFCRLESDRQPPQVRKVIVKKQ